MIENRRRFIFVLFVVTVVVAAAILLKLTKRNERTKPLKVKKDGGRMSLCLPRRVCHREMMMYVQ